MLPRAPVEHELVSVPPLRKLERHGPRAARALLERRLLHLAVGGGEDHVVLVVVMDRDERGDVLAGLGIDYVDQRHSARLALRVRQLVGLRHEDAAACGEEEHVVVRIADDEPADGVFLSGHHAGDALAAAALQPVRLERQPLHIAAVR